MASSDNQPMASQVLSGNLPAPGESDVQRSTLNEMLSLAPDTNDALDEGQNHTTFAEALTINSPFNDERFFYAGDRQGIVHTVMEICAGLRSHAGPALRLQNSTAQAKKIWQNHDWVYLQSKGVFELPTADVCDSLIREYFKHVHPMLPIIDASLFLSQYVSKGVSSINLLLLWSVFLAAANFASPETLKAAGSPSRKALKRAMYSKAKALYDSDYEDDKVCLVQSVTLLGFWYSDAEDKNGPWHWLGVAIGLCQVMGLHRMTKQSTRLRQRLFRRIWWSCFMRDRWLSLGLGRPMRINLEDCEVQMPEALDLTAELEQLAPDVANQYLLSSMSTHAVIWVKLIELSHILGRLLRAEYRGRPSDHDNHYFRMHGAELDGCQLPSDPETQGDNLWITLNRLQFEMLRDAAIVVLYRPAIDFQSAPDNSKSPTELEALKKARAAAAKTNRVVERLIELDLVHYLRPMNLTALIPAMQLHLLDCRSNRQLVRNLAWSKLGECMMVVSELRGTYWGADFTFKLFEAAQAILKASDSQSTKERGDAHVCNDENGSSNAHNDSTFASDANHDDFRPEAFDILDDSMFYLEQTYNDTLYGDTPDASMVDPWSLDNFQKMLDMPFTGEDH